MLPDFRRCCWLLLTLSFAGIAVAQEPERRPTAREQFDALVAEFEQSKNDLKELAPRFLKLAESFPKDPAAAECLVWALAGTKPEKQGAILDALLKSHLDNKALARLGGQLTYPGSERAVPFLRAIATKSPHREVQGSASFDLGVLLMRRADANRELKPGDPKVREVFEREMGQAAVAELIGADAGAMIKEAERTLELVQRKFGDLPHIGMTLAESAKAQLFELRALAIGKVAPDIEGADADGIRFKLSDYRGQVVLLDFWGFWCGPCREMIPHERSLVERFAGAPFAIVGVNSDESAAKLVEVQRSERIPWRSFYDGGATGPISRAWNVRSWPTIYVLDDRGVIRCKGVRDEELERAVTELVLEAKQRTTKK
jgi:thiol-disulfide isomerase/thioredoxin